MPRSATVLLAGMSLGNLFMLRYWQIIFRGLDEPDFAFYVTLERAHVVGAAANTLLIGAAFLVLAALARHWPRLRPGLLALFPLTLIVPLHEISKFGQLPAIGWLRTVAAFAGKWQALAVLAVLAVAAPALLALWRNRERIASVTMAVLLVLSPLLAWNWGHAAWALVASDIPSRFGHEPSAQLLPRPNERGARLLVVLFDEMDYRHIFEEGASRSPLPAFDSLRGSSFWATNAHPPADWTLQSIPSYIVGRPVTGHREEQPRDVAISFDHGRGWVSFGTSENLFTKARSAGKNSALVGWALPYCRFAFARSLSYCHFAPYISADGSGRPTSGVRGAMTAQLRGLLQIYLWDFHIQRYAGWREAALRAVSDPELDLVFLHVPVPHSPCIYDAARGRFAWFRLCWPDGYFDNVVLADRTMAEILDAVRASGLADRTHVLVTSDHSWVRGRVATHIVDRRVPLAIRLASDTTPVVYEAELSTLGVTAALAERVDGMGMHADLVRLFAIARDRESAESASAPRLSDGVRR